nr:uncharacterized protein LOC116778381 isoform X2 [Danaus plexippus plexippus]
MSSTLFEYFLDFLKEDVLNGDVPEIFIYEEILKTSQSHSVHTYNVYTINGETFTEKTDFNELKEFSIVYNNEDEEYPIDLMVKGDRVLINSAILLNQNQWNTITDDNKCHVCGVAVQDINGHISSARHKYNLDNYKPLKVFDLHITRKIGDYNHCAVCNSLYDARDHGKHVDSEIHLERMLYATNRAVDVTNDIDGTDVTSDSVSYDTNPVCDTESGFNSENTDLCDTDPGSDNVRSYASVLKQTTKNNIPLYIDFVCDNIKWKVPYDTYHMLLKMNQQFYCMFCTKFFNLRSKIVHCTSSEHLKKVETCEASDAGGHLVRRVTSRFYHCGTCNNLVIPCELELHLKKHENKNIYNKNTFKCNSGTNVNNEIVNDETKRTNDLDETKLISIKERINNTMAENRNILERNKINNTISMQYLVINRFLCDFRLNFMSYHTVIRTGFSFVCALCDVVVCDINHHVRDLTHVLSLQNAIFQPSLGINLIRMVREYAHCAICNVVLNIVDIHAHVVNQYHVTLLHNAIIHPFPPHNFANTVHVPVNNVPVMPHPFGINNRMPNMPAFHHTTNNINGNLYKTVNTENFNTSIKKNVSRHEESNALKIVDTANEETKSTASKELIGARNRNDIIDTSHMSTENTLDMSTDETRTDVVNVTNSNTKIMDDKEYESRLSNDTLYIRNRNDVIGMSQMTYNSLVRTGDGKRYCFVCSIKITLSIEEHVGSERHVDRMKECKFIAEYGKNLLRQVKNNYHCSICNVLFPNTLINEHINWSVHIDRKKWLLYDKNVHKNIITAAFRDGDSDFDIEDSIKILLNVKSGVKKSKNIGGYVIFLYGDKKLMNVTFDAYHGLNIKNRSHCNICGEYFTDRDLHLEEESHIQALETPLEVEYLPSCYRKVKDGTLNCVTCNTNFPNTKKNIKQHTSGKGHEENYSRLMEDAFTIV